MKMGNKRNLSDPYVLASFYTLRVVLIYVVFAGLWILFSDQAVILIFSDARSIMTASIVKGWGFVAVTGLLLFFLIRRLVAGTVLREAKLNALFQAIPDMVWLKDPQGIYMACNKALLDFSGLEEEDIIGRDGYELAQPEMRDYLREKDREVIAANARILDKEEMTSKKDGKKRLFETIRAPMVDARGTIVGVLGISRDITDQTRLDEERQNLREQLLQSQKMESVGRLAGGVAHDFNNMLTVILGYASVAIEKIKHDSHLRGYLEEILDAAKHSADLTRQLLAFARKQMINPKVLDLNDTVAGMLKMLQRLIGENIHLAWQPGYDLWRLKIDPSQIDQVLANLVVNARDAIGRTGNITIETGNVALDEDHCRNFPGSSPGEYVQLVVTDDGAGIDAATLEKVFEPFFTTKEAEKGTGLGLSTVYGIVAQNSGFIDVHSDVGKGTTFKIYLPRYNGADDEVSIEIDTSNPRKETAAVLLVEDGKQVLEVGKAMLGALGYTVIAATNPKEAIRLAKEHSGPIDILMTDVVMPQMNGWELSKRLAVLRPGVKCLFMSGYTADAIESKRLYGDIVFMQKPFSLIQLDEKLRQVLKT